MTGPSSIPDPGVLLAQEDFVRALARGLLHDAHDAHAVDDVVQQTWLRAMERPPGKPLALRRWLSVVVRNLVSSRLRAEQARAQR